MIPIYICEDNSEQLKAIKTTVENYIMIQDYHMKIVCAANSPEDILHHLVPPVSLGIYFLDIDLNADIDGLSLARKIRNLDPMGYIIFITSHSDRWALTFEYKITALDFIDKLPWSNLPKRICSCLQTIWEHYAKITPAAKNMIPLTLNGKRLYHDINSILFIETSHNSHRMIIHTIYKNINVSGTLNALEKVLPPCFFRCHRGFLVNLEHVVSFDEKNNSLTFASDEICPVSIRQKNKLKKLLQTIKHGC